MRIIDRSRKRGSARGVPGAAGTKRGKVTASALALALAFTLSPATMSWAEAPEEQQVETPVADDAGTGASETGGAGASETDGSDGTGSEGVDAESADARPEAPANEAQQPKPQQTPAKKQSISAVGPQADASLGLTLKQATGTEPFQDDNDPGNDDGADNAIIRTNDTITYSLGIKFSGADQTQPTIRFQLPRGQELQGLPPFCLSGSSVTPESLPAPAATLTPTSWQSLEPQTVTCVLKDEPVGSAFDYPFVAKVRSEVPNGTLMDEVTFSVSSEEAPTPVTISPERVTVSAAANYDLSKRLAGTDANKGWLWQGTAACLPPHQGEPCRVINYPLTITVPAGGKGSTPLTGDITFIENLDPASFYDASVWAEMLAAEGGDADAAKAKYGPQLRSCGTLGAGSGSRTDMPFSKLGSGSYANEQNSVRDSGTATCSSARGEAVTVTISGADTTAYTVPSTTGNGSALPANLGFLVSFELSIAVPQAAVLEFGAQGSDPANQAFTLNTHNAFTDFKATALDGTQVTEREENLANNERNASIRIERGSGLNKGFTGIPGADPGNTAPGDFMPGDALTLPGSPGAGRYKDGNTVVMPGQAVYSVMQSSSSDGAATGNFNTLVACDVWDADRLALAADPAWNGYNSTLYPGGNRPVFPVQLRWDNANKPASMVGDAASGVKSYKVEYSSGPAGPGADSDCSGGVWSEDPDQISGSTVEDGRTVWPDINRVRVTWVAQYPKGTTFSSVNLYLAIGQVVKDNTARVDEPIGNWISQWAVGGEKTTAEVYAEPTALKRITNYKPSDHSGNYGDRLWQGDAQVRLNKLVWDKQKQAFVDGGVPQYTAGDQARFRLDPSLTASVTVAGVRQRVTVEDCLPKNIVFVSSEQAGQDLTPVVAGARPDDAEIACADGRQYLRWDLGEQPVGQVIAPIVVTTEILDVAGNGTYTNNASASSPADPSPLAARSDSAQLQLVVPTGIKIAKTVDPGIVEVNPDGVTTPRTLMWSVSFANVDSPDDVKNVDVIDVLPANGLGGNGFQGALRFDSATAVKGTDITVLTTKAASATLKVDPADPSNLADGATVWCDADGQVVSGAGTAADCASSNGEVTGLRFLRAGDFKPGDDFQVDIAMTPVGNHSGDAYENITAGRADGVSQGVGPARRTATVIASEVGDFVWNDLDHDGIQDAGEPGIAGVPVKLTGTDVDGNEVSLTTETDENGRYLFSELASGDYRVEFDISGLVGFAFTDPGAGDDRASDSNADPATGLSGDFALGKNTRDHTIDAGVVQHFGGLVITKQVEGAGVADFSGDDELMFDVVCTVGDETVFEQTVELAVDGRTTITSEELTPIPVGAECTVTEIAAGHADPDALPDPVTVTIPWNEDRTAGATVTASLTNYYSAGTVQVTKQMKGDDLAVAAAEDTVFEVLVTCQIEAPGDPVARLVRDEDGGPELLTIYSGIVRIKGGQTQTLVNDDGEPLMLPLGARCFGEEVFAGNASKSTVDHDSFENGAAVTAGTPEELQQLTITAVNTFENAALTVSKKVVGPGATGAEYEFELVCTLPGTDGDGRAIDVAYGLTDADAKFALKHGESRTISVPSGATCRVAETNVPDGASVTIVDSDDTTVGGINDGTVANLTGTDNTVQVVNTFETDKSGGTDPDDDEKDDGKTGGLPITGGQALGGLALLGAGLLLAAGATILLRNSRRREADEARLS